MPQLKLDKDTQKVLEIGRIQYEFKNSEGWALAKAFFIEKIRQNNSLTEVSFKRGQTAETVLRDLQSRAKASQLILDWLTEFEGGADQAKVNEELLLRSEEDHILQYFPTQRSEDEIITQHG